MNPTLRQKRAPMRPGVIAATVGVLVTLGLIMSQAPNRASIYVADSPPTQAAATHPTTPIAPGAAVAGILRALR
jgi:hypothetical protein